MITQLAKMIFLATVFPVPLDEDDDDPNAEIPFDFLMVRTKSFYKNHTLSYFYCLLLVQRGNVAKWPAQF